MARIALVNLALAPLGGREFHAVMLAQGLQALGDEVDVWACRVDHAFAEAQGVRVKPVPVPFRGHLRDVLFSRRVSALNLRDRYDFVISMSPMKGQHVHIAGGARPTPKHERLKVRLKRRHHDLTVADAPVVVASTRSAADVLRLRLPSAGRIVGLYPPIDVSRFRRHTETERRAARAAFGFDPDRTYLLFPSTGHVRKGLDVAIGALPAFAERGVSLVVAGRPASTAPNLISLKFIDDMPSLYAAVDGTILPTRDDPFGLVVAESIRCGTPVITSVFAGAAEVMTEHDGIVIDEISVDAVRAAIEQFLSRSWPPAEMSGLEELSLEHYARAVKALCLDPAADLAAPSAQNGLT